MKTGPDPKLFDDIARVAGGAVNLFSGLQQQIQADIKSRIDDLAARMDLVPREDLERAEARITALEKKVAALSEKKTATKKTAGKKKKS